MRMVSREDTPAGHVPAGLLSPISLATQLPSEASQQSLRILRHPGPIRPASYPARRQGNLGVRQCFWVCIAWTSSSIFDCCKRAYSFSKARARPRTASECARSPSLPELQNIRHQWDGFVEYQEHGWPLTARAVGSAPLSWNYECCLVGASWSWAAYSRSGNVRPDLRAATPHSCQPGHRRPPPPLEFDALTALIPCVPAYCPRLALSGHHDSLGNVARIHGAHILAIRCDHVTAPSRAV